MSEASVKLILDALKGSLTEDNRKQIISSDGYYFGAEFHFHEPALKEEVNSFCKEQDIIFPKEYVDFLLLHNGAELIKTDSFIGLELYSLEQIREKRNFFLEWYDSDSYPIGHMCDFGAILIDNTRLKDGCDDYIWLADIVPVRFHCDFATWLDRFIISNGSSYWEWK